ncbi:carbohydrate kinase family protein [Nocardia sp. NBC_01009]|uniref:carbohydrate kinase family protein n=1 Tax=Nocardia sp. NBC_01009 TaxID=2975996 RepID=UPI0038654CF7|nr:carbohydrate kinase family protein [Nocardia sp. NBC_01009]
MVFVSYLALAELWTVAQFPRANHGAEVRSIERSVAPDGPTTAAALAALGAPTLLVANDIGRDDHGMFVRQWLAERAVECAFTIRPEVTTPRIVVAADDDHTRTWFAHLPSLTAGLELVDLAPIASASFLYVDCYEIIEQAVLRVIDAGRVAEVPMLLNLGGSDLSESAADALRGYAHLLIQTNVDDAGHAQAPAVARRLLAQAGVSWVIVTAGAFGAVAVSRSEQTSVPAFPVIVRHTHCAGAAFSGGLLFGLRAGWSMQRSMLLGSVSGALRCARHQNAPLPSLAELQAVIASREQFVAS